MHLTLILDFLVRSAKVSDACSTESVCQMIPVANIVVGAGGLLRYPTKYSIDEYVSWYLPGLGTHRFAMMLIRRTLTMNVDNEKHETVYVKWGCRWNHWDDRHDVDGFIHTAFKNMSFERSFEKRDYEMKLSEAISHLHEKN